MNYVKSIKIEKKVATIKIELNQNLKREWAEREVNAVYALLGGYNQVARNVDIETFKKFQKDFDSLVSTLSEKL